MSDDKLHNTPFGPPIPAYNKTWQEKRLLGNAIRQLIELTMTSHISRQHAEQFTKKINEIIDVMTTHERNFGKLDWINRDAHGSFQEIFYEINPFCGGSNPLGPIIEEHFAEDKLIAKTKFGWAYEGPPGYVHGGYIAAMFDHVLGSAQYLSTRQGMTRYLNTTYHRPTPIDQEIFIEAWIERVEGRKIFVNGKMYANGEVTAICEALFISANLFSEK